MEMNPILRVSSDIELGLPYLLPEYAIRVGEVSAVPGVDGDFSHVLRHFA